MCKKLLIVIVSIVAGSCSSTSSSTAQLNYNNLSPLAVSYEKIINQNITPYDLLIVEPNHYNKDEVDQLKSSGAIVLAYISLGEVNKNRWYYPILEERGFLGKNENWDSFYINLADSVTYNLFFEEIIPELALRDFDGLFLDTVDAVAPYTPRSNLEPHMVRLIRQIRSEYPTFTIIQNAGFFLLPQTAASLDAVLIEDVATHYNFQTDSYTLKPAAEYNKKITTINTLSEENEIPFLILDFAKSESLRALAKQRLDSLAYPYFINNIELNSISTGISGNNY